jgi:hypothetical protein
MKRTFVKLQVVLLGVWLFVTFSAFADTSYTVMLTPSTSNSNQTSHPSTTTENSPKGHRSLSQPIMCTISEIDGLSISNVDQEDIYVFEIFDENGSCIASCLNEADFIYSLFSLSGCAQIRLTIDDVVYVGNLYY